MSSLEDYRAGLATTSFRLWLRVMRSSILNANLGAWLFYHLPDEWSILVRFVLPTRRFFYRPCFRPHRPRQNAQPVINGRIPGSQPWWIAAIIATALFCSRNLSSPFILTFNPAEFTKAVDKGALLQWFLTEWSSRLQQSERSSLRVWRDPLVLILPVRTC